MHIEKTYSRIALLLLVLFFSVGAAKADSSTKSLGLKTVVIDPGHGGKDPGAPGKTSKTSEKHIVLSVAKKLGDRITKQYPDVKVIYTRSTDVFIELNERAKIARRNKADLFISIHCNSNKSQTPYGASVHILGPKSKNSRNQKDYFAASMDVARRENSVILLEDNYETVYQGFDPDSPESVISHNLMWNANYANSLLFASEVDGVFTKAPFRSSNYTGIHQDTFLLLWSTNMPAALLEIGFISNPGDYKILSTAEGQDAIAESLFKAFASYKTQYDMTLNIDAAAASETPQPAQSVQQAEPALQEAPVKQEKPVEKPAVVKYGIQVMTLSRYLPENDPSFKGYKALAVRSGSVYKYIIGVDEDKEKVASMFKDTKTIFPGSFIVKVDGEKVERL